MVCLCCSPLILSWELTHSDRSLLALSCQFWKSIETPTYIGGMPSQSYTTVIQTLQDLQIPFLPNRGSLFVWIDFGRFLRSDDQEGEDAFWTDLYHKTGILLTPAQGFGHSGYGMFRLVHPFFAVSDLGVAMERLKAYLSAQ